MHRQAFYSAEAGVGVGVGVAGAVVFKRIDNCFGIRMGYMINLDEEDNMEAVVGVCAEESWVEPRRANPNRQTAGPDRSGDFYSFFLKKKKIYLTSCLACIKVEARP